MVHITSASISRLSTQDWATSLELVGYLGLGDACKVTTQAQKENFKQEDDGGSSVILVLSDMFGISHLALVSANRKRSK